MARRTKLLRLATNSPRYKKKRLKGLHNSCKMDKVEEYIFLASEKCFSFTSVKRKTALWVPYDTVTLELSTQTLGSVKNALM